MSSKCYPEEFRIEAVKQVVIAAMLSQMLQNGSISQRIVSMPG